MNIMYIAVAGVTHFIDSLKEPEGLQDMFYYHNSHNNGSLNILFKEVFLYCNLFCSLVCTMLYLHKWKNWIELLQCWSYDSILLSFCF